MGFCACACDGRRPVGVLSHRQKPRPTGPLVFFYDLLFMIYILHIYFGSPGGCTLTLTLASMKGSFGGPHACDGNLGRVSASVPSCSVIRPRVLCRGVGQHSIIHFMLCKMTNLLRLKTCARATRATAPAPHTKWALWRPHRAHDLVHFNI